jgi:alanine-glyoxylate transaminase/serine-glyoxylate transaminase/serine-pyruvate transaminase
MSLHTGRHFLQIPGPTNVPDRVLHATALPTIDHRGPEFGELGLRVLSGVREAFQTSGPVIIYPASGTGAWEAALMNTLQPGDAVVIYETGHFATLWAQMARELGLDVTFLEGDWRHGVQADRIGEVLEADTGHRIRAVLATHNETSTAVTSDIPAVRAMLDRLGHPALLLVDTVSSLGSIDYRHEEWGVDVTVSGSQKGLMLPPGISFTAVSERAIEASRTGGMPRSYWRWEPMLAANETGFFPFTPATNLLYGLEVALEMLREEGYPQVFARHHRLAEATRRAVTAWGLELLAMVPSERSDALTAVLMPDGHDADALRAVVLDRFDTSLGAGLGKVKGRVFRIGHLGHFNEPMLLGTLGAVEAGLVAAGVPFTRGGVDAAIDHLVATATTGS